MIRNNKENNWSIGGKIVERGRAKSSEGRVITSKTEKTIGQESVDHRVTREYESVIHQRIHKYIKSNDRDNSIWKSIISVAPKKTNYYKIDVNESTLQEIQIFEGVNKDIQNMN